MPTKTQQPLPSDSLPEHPINLLDFQRMFPDETAYLDEYMFRFNRRFYRSVSFQKLLGLGILHSGPTYQEIYDVANRENSTKRRNGVATG